MGKALKIFLKILAGFIIVVVTTFGVVNFVNPNQFKGFIESEVLKQSGHVLKIQGSLSWKWYPILALEMQNVELDNVAPFTGPFLSVKTASADCAFASLISGRILLNIKLQGLSLALQRNQNNESNWEQLQKRFSDPKPSDASHNTPSVLLNSLKLEEGEISYKDAAKTEVYNINHLTLSANNFFKAFLGNATPISLNFDFSASNKPTLNVSLSTTWSFKQDPKKIQFNNIDFKCKSIDGKIFNLTGALKVQDFDKELIAMGNVATHNLDLNSWLLLLGFNELPSLPNIAKFDANFKVQNNVLAVNDLNIALDNNGALNGNFGLDLKQLTPKALKLQGELTGKQLFIGKLKLDSLKTTFKGTDGVLAFDPINLQMNNMQQKATLQIDLRNTTPKFAITQEAKDFEMSQFLAIFDVKNKLEGKTTTKMTLTTSGTTLNDFLKNLNGDVKIAIMNGNLYGIDLLKLLKSAQTNVYSLLSAFSNKQAPNTDATLNTEAEKWSTSISSNSTTPFNSITATGKITNGLLRNQDLAMVHSEYTINGSGTLNLPNQTIQYQASVMLKNNPYPATDQIAQFLYQTPLSITVLGSIHDPIIRPDLKSYFNDAFKFTQKQVVEKVIDKTVKKALGKMLKLNQE